MILHNIVLSFTHFSLFLFHRDHVLSTSIKNAKNFHFFSLFPGTNNCQNLLLCCLQKHRLSCVWQYPFIDTHHVFCFSWNKETFSLFQCCEVLETCLSLHFLQLYIDKILFLSSIDISISSPNLQY